MLLPKQYVRPTFPDGYGSADYHGDIVQWRRVNHLSLLGGSAWYHKFYDYPGIARHLQLAWGGMNSNRLTSAECAMHRAACLHGVSTGVSHADIGTFPPTLLEQTGDRKRAGGELTEASFDAVSIP